MWYSSPVTAWLCDAHGSRRAGTVRWRCSAPSGRFSSQSPLGRSQSSSRVASCLSSARCPDTVARLADIRGGVSRRTSGRTLSRSERGDPAMAERGPPSPPRPSCQV